MISLGQALPFFGPPPSALAAAARRRSRRARCTSTRPIPACRRCAARSPSGFAIGRHCRVGRRHHHHGRRATTPSRWRSRRWSIRATRSCCRRPYFTNHQMAVAALGAIPVEAPVHDRETFSVRWSDIEPHLGSRTRAVVLCNPSNPTGAVLDPDEGERIVSELARRDIVVFSDETVHAFRLRPASLERCVRCRLAPQRRRDRHVLEVVRDDGLARRLHAGRRGGLRRSGEDSGRDDHLRAGHLADGRARRRLATTGHYPESFHPDFLQRRQALIDGVRAIPQLHWTPTTGAFFGFVRVDGCTDSAALADRCSRRRTSSRFPARRSGAAAKVTCGCRTGPPALPRSRKRCGGCAQRYFRALHRA